MIITLGVLLAGSVAEVAAQKWQDWLGAAVLVRMGVGLAQTILVTYIAELAPFQVRGMLIGAYQVLLTTGQLVVAVSAELVRVHQPTEWRVLVAIEFLFTGVSSILLDPTLILLDPTCTMTDILLDFLHPHHLHPRVSHFLRSSR